MLDLIKKFPSQLEQAMQIGEWATLTQHHKPITKVCIAWLGWSGIGASIVRDYVNSHFSAMIEVTKDYNIPKRVDSYTLVIINSYSGNTEETISAMNQALEKDAKIVAISSWGKIQKIAQENRCDHIQVPTGYPPRSALAYSLVQQLYILLFFWLIDDTFKTQIKQSIYYLAYHQKTIEENAQTGAKQIHNTYPVIYSASDKEWVAIRFRQQLNENAKILCHHHVVPEMNHNELVGRAGANTNYSVLRLQTSFDHPKITQRMDINKEIINKYTHKQYDILAEGESYREQILYLIHFTDYISVYLAAERGVDATEVKVIDYLKKSLEK